MLYYKRLDKCKFKVKDMLHEVEKISAEELEILLSGFDHQPVERKQMYLEHSA